MTLADRRQIEEVGMDLGTQMLLVVRLVAKNGLVRARKIINDVENPAANKGSQLDAPVDRGSHSVPSSVR